MKRQDYLAAIGLLLPSAFVISLYIYIGSFNRMLGDDYCSLYFGQRLGLLRSIWYWYTSWHGGFSASAMDWLISIFGAGAFPFHTFVFLATWLLLATLAAREALRFRGYSSFRLAASLFLAILLVFTTLRLSPDIIESLFWWGGARGYLSPLVFFTLYFALYFAFLNSPSGRIPAGIWMFASFGLAFFTGGFSEVFTPVLVVLLLGLAGIRLLTSRFRWKDASFLFLTAGFLGAMFALLVMVLAPGNSIRQEYFPPPPDLLTILRIASASYLAYFYEIIASPFVLTGLLGCVVGSIWLGMRMNRGSDVVPLSGGWIAGFLFAGLILAFGCFPAPVYGTSEPAPARTLIIPSFLLTACFMMSGFTLGERLSNRGRGSSALALVVFVIGCGLLIYSSYRSAQQLYSMRDAHDSFAQVWDKIDAEIREAKKSGLEQVQIPSMTNWADAPFPTENPKYWPNICYSKYYGINVFAPPLEP